MSHALEVTKMLCTPDDNLTIKFKYIVQATFDTSRSRFCGVYIRTYICFTV